MNVGSVERGVISVSSTLNHPDFDEEDRVEILAQASEAVLGEEAQAALRERLAPSGDAEENPPPPPPSNPPGDNPPQPTREERILEGVGKLDPENEDHFTKSGVPDVSALREASGVDDVSAAERDAAWKEHQKAG